MDLGSQDHTAIDAAWEQVQCILLRWRNGGTRNLRNGATLICHVPHIAPQAWLHEIHGRLKPRRLRLLEAKIGRPLPDELKKLYTHANGLNVFSDSLTVWGWIGRLHRSGDEAYQPYSITSLHLFVERFSGCPEEFLFFGSCARGCSVVGYPSPLTSPEVWQVGRRTGTRQGTWPSLAAWLLEQTGRLAGYFDPNGRSLATHEEIWGDSSAEY